VDSVTGKNSGNNLGPGSPTLHVHQSRGTRLDVRLILKGGGCENVGAQYSLPDTRLGANRDLDGVRKVILDAVVQAQGKGCSPGILGVCIGGDRATGYLHSKEQLLRTLEDASPDPALAAMEQKIVRGANTLGIGPMGFGGNTTLLGCKIGVLNRLPASFFVSISYMCWAYRRQGILLATRPTRQCLLAGVSPQGAQDAQEGRPPGAAAEAEGKKRPSLPVRALGTSAVRISRFWRTADR
jgi:fumarate hydratase class I